MVNIHFKDGDYLTAASDDQGNEDSSHMWQSRVEIEHYSIAYFDRIAAFEAL